MREPDRSSGDRDPADATSPRSFLGIEARVWWVGAMAIAFGVGVGLSTWVVRLPRPAERRAAAVRVGPNGPAPAPPASEPGAPITERSVAPPAVSRPTPAPAPIPSSADRAVSSGAATAARAARDGASRPATPTPVPSPPPAVSAVPAATPLPPVVGVPAPVRDADPMAGAPALTVLPAAPPPAPAAPAAALRDEAAVRRTLDDYAVAYRALDVAATAQAWPTVDRQALGKAFATLKSQDVTFDTCAVSVEGAQAVARCRGAVRFVRKVGAPGARVASQQWEFRMRRVEGAWKIDDVRAAPSGASAP